MRKRFIVWVEADVGETDILEALAIYPKTAYAKAEIALNEALAEEIEATARPAPEIKRALDAMSQAAEPRP